MSKAVNRFLYKAKKVSKSLLSECTEAFLYLLWLSSAPTSAKVFTNCLDYQFRKRTIETTISRLYKKGYISKIKGKKGFFDVNTTMGNLLWPHLDNLRLHKYQKKWDGLWRLVIYDIPEKQKNKRDILRDYLKYLGFGKIQGSSWASPYDFSAEIHTFCNEQKILEHICIYEGKVFTGKDIDKFVQGAWRLEELNNEYQAFIELCNVSLERVATEKITPKDCCELYFKVYSSYVAAIQKDPFLPNDFTPNFPRKKVEHLFKRFCEVVSKELHLVM